MKKLLLSLVILQVLALLFLASWDGLVIAGLAALVVPVLLVNALSSK